MSAGLPWLQVVAVAVGSAVGALLRWWAGVAFNHQWSGFPLGTLLVNCVGGLMIGAAVVWFDRTPNEVLRLLLITGFLGGLTTFSAFSGESLSLVQRGEYAWALAHTVAHVVGSLASAAIGFRLMRAWLA